MRFRDASTTLFGKVLVLILFACAVSCRAAAEQARIPHAAHSGDLVSTLEFISTTFHLPIIAELTKHYPPSVTLSAGEESAVQLLNELKAEFLTYDWVDRNGVILFYDRRLYEAPGNFFSAKIPWFVMPADLAQLRLELNNAMVSPQRRAAPVMAGVIEPGLQLVKLRKGEILTNVSGRDILIQAAKQSRNLFSVALFPTANPKTKNDITEAHANWYIRSIDELPGNPTRLRSIPQSLRVQETKQ